MPHILVSGIGDLIPTSPRRCARTAEVVVVGDSPRWARGAEAGPGAFDGYVQLPARFGLLGDTAVDRIHHFVVHGLMARYPAMAAALPALAPGARITFVPAVLPAEVATDDDVEARAALLRVLAPRPGRTGGRAAGPVPRLGRHPGGDRAGRPWAAARSRGRCRPSRTGPTPTGGSSCWA